MEEGGEKRKPDNNDVVSKSAMKKKKKPKEEAKTPLKEEIEVEEEEVEEFFAILRRIQVAIKYFNNVNEASGSGSGDRKMTEDIDRNIDRKCSNEIIGVNEEMKEPKKEKDDDKEENNKGFDLNMEPYDPHDDHNSS